MSTKLESNIASSTLRHSLNICYAMQQHDARDYRVMMAREVYSKRMHRVCGVHVHPADCARLDNPDLSCRTLADRVESENGEPLI